MKNMVNNKIASIERIIEEYPNQYFRDLQEKDKIDIYQNFKYAIDMIKNVLDQ